MVLDDVFSVVYIPSHVETVRVFNDIRKEILKDIEEVEHDFILKNEINENFQKINEKIQELTTVCKIEEVINTNLKVFDDAYKVTITSQSVVDDLSLIHI